MSIFNEISQLQANTNIHTDSDTNRPSLSIQVAQTQLGPIARRWSIYSPGSRESTPSVVDVRIKSIQSLVLPLELRIEIPTNPDISMFVHKSRDIISHIISGEDDRLFVIVGPCSIHDVSAALDYAKQLKELSLEYANTLFIGMRVYFEKPRTTIGWKGLINDPDLNGSYNIERGLRLARKLLIDINTIGLPVCTELLDTITPQYLSALISWAAIGARTTESQLHRELVSGLSMPVGFKNGTSGSVKIAVDACVTSRSPHSFLSITEKGQVAIVETKGNPHTHIILRGSDTTGPNYSSKYVNDSAELLIKNSCSPGILVDCSHGNSNKDYLNQSKVIDSVCQQLLEPEIEIESNNFNPNVYGCPIIGVMIESNLVSGSQILNNGIELIYGQSITDGCIDIELTSRLIKSLNQAVIKRRELQLKFNKTK